MDTAVGTGLSYGIALRVALRAASLPFVLAVLSVAALPLAAQYSTIELTNSGLFPKSAQTGFGQPIATDGTWVVYSTGNALWSQPVGGGKVKRIFVAGDILPGSSSKVSLIYPQVVVTGGIAVFLATDNSHSSDALFGLYSIKADGSATAQRVADSTVASTSTDWYDDMDPYGYVWLFQASNGIAVFALEGSIYSANLDGSNLKTLWATAPAGFSGCETAGTYHTLFLDDQAYQPATNGSAYAFAAGSTLEFEGLYHGPLTLDNSCDNLINSGISKDDVTTPVKILPGQPIAAGPFAFINTGQSIQIDGEYVYFGASVTNGVSAKEDYTGYFKIPLGGGKAEAVVTNLSHVPGLTNPSGGYAQVNLMGFAVNNGRFVFLAQDVKSNDPAAFYLVKGPGYEKLFTSGTSVSDLCVGALEYGSLAGLNQVSLSSDGLLAFSAELRAATVPDKSGPCSWPQVDYRFQPIGYFVVDASHPLIPTETEIAISPALPIVYGEKPSFKIKVLPAAGAKDPKELVPTGVVTVWYTNPEYFGAQQPHAPSAKLNADGEATISLGAQQIGTYTYVVTYGGDTEFSSSTSSNIVFPLHVTAPTFSVKGGTYKSTQSINISDITPGSTIYYTLDGSTPTKKSQVFETTISVSKNTTIRAMAVATGDENSTVTSATYTIE